jgi:hypothetical protein
MTIFVHASVSRIYGIAKERKLRVGQVHENLCLLKNIEENVKEQLLCAYIQPLKRAGFTHILTIVPKSLWIFNSLLNIAILPLFLFV